jgi:Rhodopirellula transposase DDE domain
LVECKKKELLGQFKNNGAEWQAKGEATEVNVYDFRSLADGKPIPYGIYDLVHNHGFVNVGIDHDTAFK